jgi:hypothetical protein
MIHNLISATSLIAAIASAFAADFWFRASQVPAPPAALLGHSFLGSRTRPGPTAAVDASPLVKYAQESGRWNKIAAWCSAVAALFACIAALLTACASSTIC